MKKKIIAAAGSSMSCKPLNHSRPTTAKRQQLNRKNPVAQTDQYSADFHDELLIVRHSGEIPEVALHGSLFFLSCDPEGPRATLSLEEMLELKKMAVERYREIIKRDLDPENRNKGLYRGLARCIANWQRMESFCLKENFPVEVLRKETAMLLISFIKNEVVDVKQNNRSSSVNCGRAELENFAEKLGLKPETLPEGWPELCPCNC